MLTGNSCKLLLSQLTATRRFVVPQRHIDGQASDVLTMKLTKSKHNKTRASSSLGHLLLRSMAFSVNKKPLPSILAICFCPSPSRLFQQSLREIQNLHKNVRCVVLYIINDSRTKKSHCSCGSKLNEISFKSLRPNNVEITSIIKR